MTSARAVHCELQPPRQAPRVGPDSSSSGNSDQVKIVLQPRLCTLRSYAADRGGGVIRTVVGKPKDGGDGGGSGGEDVVVVEEEFT
ncbi:Stress enhanced protein 2 chloroplastic [Bienertia sinuspersici]